MKADSLTLSLMKTKNEMNANIKIKIIKNRADDLTNKELIIKKSRVRHVYMLFIKVMLAFTSTFNKNNARVNRNCA